MIPHKSFYFIRHGETEWNKLNLYTGSKDIPLNQTGIAQAKKAALLLKNKDIAHIVSSKLMRASQTAEIIAQTINKPISIAKNIEERYLGSKEGKPIDPYIPIEQLIITTNHDEEKSEDFQNRVILAIKEILSSFPENTLIVAHGGVYSTMCRSMNWPIIEIENCLPVYHMAPSKENNSWQIIPLDID